MCGFVGFYQTEPCGIDLHRVIHSMNNSLSHRGPDDGLVWADPNSGLVLGHRRLSIIDLSEHGRQPMVSRNGRWVMVFNGEIYNFEALRKQLAGYEWHGHSDTEVLLAIISTYGFIYALNNIIGMFAIAVWDIKDRKLYLARDRFGEKPLYYGFSNKTFLFSSELKSLYKHPSWNGSVDASAMNAYFRYGYVPAPYSIYAGIKKLVPGTWVVYDANTDKLEKPLSYWSTTRSALDNVELRHSQPQHIALDQGLDLLRDIIKGQMVADVPVGAFLSGGIDSTLITSILAEQSVRPIKTFTIGFTEEEYNEAPFAKTIANYLGTEHTEFYISPHDVIDIIPSLSTVYDEPFADSSQVPTLLLCKYVSRSVKVALSGDGGDELFCGYNRYALTGKTYKTLFAVPKIIRKLVGSTLKKINFTYANRLSSIFPESSRIPNLHEKLCKFSDVIAYDDPMDIYGCLISQGAGDGVLVNKTEFKSLWKDAWNYSNINTTEKMMLSDCITYLPDDLLVKIDRASMHYSLEMRSPFLDHRLFEFSWRLPVDIQSGVPGRKYFSRELVKRYIPDKLIDRKKQGFALPLAPWLRGELRDWAESLLCERVLTSSGWLNTKEIRKMWKEHLSGYNKWQNKLWTVLMFQSWHSRWG